MKHRLRLSIAVVALSLLHRVFAEPATGPIGHWEGQVTLPSIPLAIRIDLDRIADTWSATIDIPVQGLRGFKLDPVKVDGDTVELTLPNIPGNPQFSGRWDKESRTISGDFSQNGLKLPFKVERRERPAPAAGDTPAKGVPGEGLVGHWQASLKPAPVIEMRLAMEITKAAAGTYEGMLVSVDQEQARIPITSLTEADGKVVLRAASVQGKFDGALSADGSEITGEWQQMGPKLPLSFKRLAKAPEFSRPQDPKPPYPYRAEEVAIPNDAAGVKLAGTLTLPHGQGPHPAVVLITGSGPQDRNEALMGHRPFLVLADHLTRAGFAVLRCDDRGVAKSTGDFEKALIEDFVSDTLAAVAWLQTRREVDPRRIGLVGHSEGGIVAPLAAVRNPEAVSFIALLAGVGVPADQLLLRQAADLQRVAGMNEDAIARNQKAQLEIFTLLKDATDSKTITQRARAIIEESIKDYTPEQRTALGINASFLDAQIKMISSPRFRALVGYNPSPVLRRVKCPVLAINGEKDLQVAAQENLEGIRTALTEGGNTQVQIVELPGLNHLFQTCTTGAIAEYGQIEETFAPAALQTVSNWLRDQAKK